MSHHVVLLAYDGLATFEFGLAAEVFGLPRPELSPWYSCAVAAADPPPLRAVGGVRVLVDAGLEALEQADTIIVPGWRGIDTPVPEALVDALVAAHRRGCRLVSLCSGVVVLAAAGVLDGKRAATHWRYAARVGERFPALRVDADVLYVDEGQVLTAAGSAAGLDLLLHIVRQDFGSAVAASVAKRLVIAPFRDGGQAQFVDQPIQPRGAAVARAMEWALTQLVHGPIPVAALARAVHMSPRSFHRKFVAATGQSPADWLTRARVDHARAALEGGPATLQEVSDAAGFGSVDALRHHFQRVLGVSPAAYRRRFRAPAAG